MRLSHISISLLYIFALINTFHAVKDGSIGRFLDVIVLLTLVLSTAIIVQAKRVSLSKVFQKKYLYIVFLLFFLIIAVLSTGVSFSKLFLIIAYATTGLLSFQFLGYIILKDEEIFKVLLKTVVYSSLFVCFTALISFTGINGIFGLTFSEKFGAYSLGPINATAGVLEHPNTFGTILVFTIGALIYMRQEFNNVLYWALFGTFCFFLFTTFTRGPWAAFFGAFVFTKIYGKIPRWGFYVISIFMLLIISFSSVPQVTGFQNETLNSLFRVDQGLSGRGVMWPFAFALIINQPLLGYGFRSSSAVKNAFASDDILRYAPDSAFHNTFITTAVELGLIIGIFYFIVFFKSFDNIYKSKISKRKKNFLVFTSVTILLSVMAVDYNIGGLRSVSLLLSIFLGAAYQSLKHRY